MQQQLVDFLDSFHKEVGNDQKDRDGYRMDAEAFINTGNMYLWKNEQGDHVASCKFAPNGKLASNACYEKIGYVLRGKLCTIS